MCSQINQFYEEKKGGSSVPIIFGALFRTAHPAQEQRCRGERQCHRADVPQPHFYFHPRPLQEGSRETEPCSPDSAGSWLHGVTPLLKQLTAVIWDGCIQAVVAASWRFWQELPTGALVLCQCKWFKVTLPGKLYTWNTDTWPPGKSVKTRVPVIWA